MKDDNCLTAEFLFTFDAISQQTGSSYNKTNFNIEAYEIYQDNQYSFFNLYIFDKKYAVIKYGFEKDGFNDKSTISNKNQSNQVECYDAIEKNKISAKVITARDYRKCFIKVKDCKIIN